jgi:hypothetical protein
MKGDILPKADRASMANSLKVRVPVLNHMMVEYVSVLPHGQHRTCECAGDHVRAPGVDMWEVINAAATKPFGFMKFAPGPGLDMRCIILRAETEWTEPVGAGWNRQVGSDPDLVLAAVTEWFPTDERPNIYRNAHEAEKITGMLRQMIKVREANLVD